MKLLPLDLCLGQVYFFIEKQNEIPYDTAQILESANGSRVRLTKIMFDGYLSHTTTFNRKGADRISGWRKNIQDYRKGDEIPAYTRSSGKIESCCSWIAQQRGNGLISLSGSHFDRSWNGKLLKD